ncbi:MAG TPA: glycoside hydrolase family 18 protein, partial [Anaerolineae bacterium]|nr:glycoside hydrolase family 18 protein [Anaerolineae bacterium]
LASLVLAPAAAATAPGGASAKQVVGYFIEWGIYGRSYLVKDIAASGSAPRLTVINYAFGNVAPGVDGQVVCMLGDEWADYQKPWTAAESVDGQEVAWPNPILGNFQQLKALKALHPNLRVVISLGGWTWSKYFSDAALTPESRQAFVQSCVDLFIRGNLPDPGWGGMGGPGAAAGVFDGIDVDWEYPAAEGNPGNIVRPEDTPNFTALLAEFRRQLDAVRPGLLLTIAAPAAESKYALIELDHIHTSLDWINLMTYDFHGTWEMSTNFQANLRASAKDPSSPAYSVEATVHGYLAAGVPADKLVVGVPFYGRGWTGVTNLNRGLYQPAAAPAPGVWEAGVNDFKALRPLVGAGGFERYWDGHTMDAWLFDGSTFWTYDDEQTIRQKALYIRKMGLGGFMFWELSGDDAGGTLVKAIAAGLGR